jgi:multidrug efflux system membrane fusion protein
MSRLTNIRNYDPMRLECSVSEQYLPAVRSAMEAGVVNVTVTSRGDTNSYPGTLLFMDNAVNPAAGTILLRGVVPNPEMKLWANQFVDVKIIVAMQSGAVMVPESAVMLGKTSPYLYVVSGDQKAELRLVKTGVRHNNRVQIVEGVAGGETVVSVGQLKLYPGATVIDASKLPAAGQGR